MRYFALILGIIFSSVACADDLVNWLQSNNPREYFPQDGKYISFPNICNDHTCFDVVAVFYVSESRKGMRKLAVFSKSGSFLGSYSGFQEMPLKVNGSQLLFPDSKFGSSINFAGTKPPVQAYIDGEVFKFEPKP